MGVPINNVPRRVVFAADGVGPYAFTFEILAAGDIAVFRDDTLLTITTDYTVTINPDGTGSVTLVADPTGATQIAIVGNRTIQRISDFVTGGDFFANTLNDELDQQTIFAQQNAEGLARSLQAPITDPTNVDMTLPRAGDRAGKYLAFDENGNPRPGDTAVEVAAVFVIRDEIQAVAAIDDEVVVVAGNATNVNTVAGISANVTTVAGIAPNVTTVAGNTSNINTVAGNNANVTTVAGSISNVNAVGTNISNVNAVAGNATNINAVNANKTNIDTVAGIDADVSTVSGISAAVSTVATNDANVTAVAGNATNINAVAGNNANITAVAGNATNINAVNANATNINTVAGISTNVTTVAGISSDVTAVAGVAADIPAAAAINPTDLATVAGISGNVTTVAGVSADVTAVAGIASDIPTVAANVADITNFADVYQGPKTTDPSTRNDSSALQAGDLYFNTVDGAMKVYTGVTWVAAYISQDGFVTIADAQTITGAKTFSGGLSTSNATITGGSISGITDLAVADGGTGASDAAGARSNLGAQEALVSGTNIKTINSESLLGSGNIVIVGEIPLGLFRKVNPEIVAWTKTGNDTATTSGILYVEVNGVVRTIASGTSITMPTLAAGTDYAIWCKPDGTLEATSNHTSPPVANSRKVGGFHYAPGGNATAQSGGNTTAQINEFSFWDLKWRPSCADPRGMTLVAGGFWSDIYLTGVDAITNGSSKYNVTMADGSSPPKVPTMFGGNGSTTYGSYTWFEAMELGTAFGKRCPTQQEFMSLAYGTTEASSVGSDQVSTILNAAYTSRWGVIQSAGVLWVWGRDRGGPFASAAWNANTEGRGSEFSAPNSARFGGAWTDGAVAGSRCSVWNVAASNSGNNIGSRFVCDHLQLD
jgi:hypothetical protein